MPELVPDAGDTQSEQSGPHEYTWKTLLCECETSEQALELREALRRAGIESWVEGPRTDSRYVRTGRENPRVLVAADQLDAARAIAANPIPQEIADESQDEVPEFVEPKCPKCGADDAGARRCGPRKHVALRAMRRAMDRIGRASGTRKRQRRAESAL